MKVEIDSRALLRALAKLAKSATDMREAMEGIGDALEQSTALRFVDEKDPRGRKWAPLSPVTLADKKRGGKLSNILQRDGLMKLSFSHNATSNTAEVGTNKAYAPTHQFGAKRGAFGRTKRGAPIPWGDIPARPFLGISGEDEEEIIKIIHDHLKQAARP